MNAAAITFMLLTMGGVLALNALCLALWLRQRKPLPPPTVTPPPAGTAAEPPAS